MIERIQSRLRRYVELLPFAFILLLVSVVQTSAGEPDFSAIDKDGNGVIEPAEISAGDFSVIARYASLAGLEISKPMPVARLELGRGRYLQSLEGGDAAITLGKQAAGEHEFGQLNKGGVRPFGNAGDYAGTYTGYARGGAFSLFRKFDANRDGLLSQGELSNTYRSRSRSWMRGDRDKNGVLTFAEVVYSLSAEGERQGGARAHKQSTWNVDGVEITPQHRRLAARLMTKFDKNKNGNLEAYEVPNDWKRGDFLSKADLNGDGQISKAEMQMGSSHYVRENQRVAQLKKDPNMQHCEVLAAGMIRNFDRNKDRTLNSWEWPRIGGDIADGDLNGNGMIVKEELVTWLFNRVSSQPGANLPDDLPSWFLESDADLDGQVMMSEFVTAQSRSRLLEFSHYDRNSDGIVTPKECGERGGVGKTRYVSRTPRVLEAQKDVYSEIFIPDRIRIKDVDVQISIVKNGNEYLDIRLVGPDGTTAVLFYTSRRKAWDGGPLFNNTIIDDEAPRSLRRLPSPPSHHSFRPQSMGHPKLLSLKAFYGKPAKGTWRLVVGNKDRDAGLLEGWALLVKSASTGSRVSLKR